MKKLLKNLAAVFFVLMSDIMMADPPEPPDPGGNPSGGGGVPVGAPIDDGLLVLLVMGILFGIYQFYVHWRKIEKPGNAKVN